MAGSVYHQRYYDKKPIKVDEQKNIDAYFENTADYLFQKNMDLEDKVAKEINAANLLKKERKL